MKTIIITAMLALLAIVPAHGQNEKGSSVDIFMGVDLHYRDIDYNKLYEVLVNLTPGVKWNMGHQWRLAGQVVVPVYNDYGGRYKKVRLNMAVLSKEMHLGSQHLKASAGLFGSERYGVDLKWMWPVATWLAFDGQVGYTGFCSMAKDWECSKMDRLTGELGARVYLSKWNTEFRAHGGRYIYEDYGVTGECMRHFKHCTVGIYGQYSEIGEENAGFKVIIMLPPYRRKARRVNFRPASNFRHVYNVDADFYSMQMYTTDPEENEREGNFDRNSVKWGSNTMEPDFEEKGGDR